MKTSTKFWIAMFLIAAERFYTDIYPNLTSSEQNGILVYLLMIYIIWEVVFLFVRLDLMASEDWLPTLESVFQYANRVNNTNFYLAGVSLLYLVTFGIRRLNAFLNKFDL